jgi:hypothetical protein
MLHLLADAALTGTLPLKHEPVNVPDPVFVCGSMASPLWQQKGLG